MIPARSQNIPVAGRTNKSKFVEQFANRLWEASSVKKPEGVFEHHLEDLGTGKRQLTVRCVQLELLSTGDSIEGVCLVGKEVLSPSDR